VVDGEKLHISNFTKAIIPPSMSEHTVTLDSCIHGITKVHNKPYILVILHEHIILYSYEAKKIIEKWNLKFDDNVGFINTLIWGVEVSQLDPLTIKIGNIEL